VVDHSSVGGGETAAETGRGLEGHVVRHPNEVDLRMIDGHKFCERSPVGEPGLELSVTHLVFAPSAGLALAARADERSRDPVTEVPSLYPRADLGDHAGEFMARDVWESDIRVVPHPPVPVTSAQTSGCHFNDNAGFRTTGVIYGDYFGQLLESLV
jgi:hypothetical protein